MKKSVLTGEKQTKNRQELLDEIDRILKTYCEGCFLFQQFKNDHGRRYAHSFCIHQCTVGMKLKEIGQKLT